MEQNDSFLPISKRAHLAESNDNHLPTWETRLRDVSNDCLANVLDYLEGADLVRLINTGEKGFCAKVLHSAQRFSHTFLAHKKVTWPKIVSQLYNLRYLQLIVNGVVVFGKFLILDAYSLPSSLVSLTLNGFVFRVESAHILAPQLFPRLRYIDIFGSRFEETTSVEGVAAQKKISLQVAQAITSTFTNLDSFSLPTAVMCDQTFASSISTVLQTLVTGRVAAGIDFSHLHLKTLHIMLPFGPKPSIMPATLTDLNLGSIPIGADNTGGCAPTFPPTLTRLQLHVGQERVEKYFCNQTVLAQLSLFRLRCIPSSTLINKALFAAICGTLPFVKSLQFDDRTRFDEDIDMSLLPPSMTEIASPLLVCTTNWKNIRKTCRVLKVESFGGLQATLDAASLMYIQDLPNILESVRIFSSDPSVYTLPRRDWNGLATLDATLCLISPSFFESLPSTLTMLRVYTPKHIQLNDTCFAHLTNLHTLDLSAEMAAPVYFTTSFGQQIDLRTLHLVNNESKQGVTTAASDMLFDVWLACLPRSTTSLRLKLEGRWSCSNNQFRNCDWPPLLRKLELNMRMCVFDPLDVKESVSTLRYLYKFFATFADRHVTLKMHNGESSTIIISDIFDGTKRETGWKLVVGKARN